MEQIQTALANMGNILEGRDSVFTTPDDRKPLTQETVLQRVQQSILSTFEERCSRTGVLKATWIFNRNSNKFILNQLRRNNHFKFNVRLL